MKKSKVLFVIGFLCVFLLAMNTFVLKIYANSAEPPRLVVIVNFPPEDLKLYLRFEDGSMQEAIELLKTKTAWEAQYRFRYGMLSMEKPSLENVTLIAKSSEKNFEYMLEPFMLNSYNNVITLDFTNEIITNGKTFTRTVTLVSMRVICTLFIEGIVFLAFRYRGKQNYLIFLIINLITQGILNVILNQSSTTSYIIIGLFIYEVIIFIVESIAFTKLLKESNKLKTISYVFVANLLSFILGGYLITNLPL